MVYKILKTVQSQPSIEEFENEYKAAFDVFLSNPDTAEFGQYFQKTYGNSVEQWATCYRKNASINTNAHLESFHRVLKYNYLNKKSNRRIDKLIFALLKVNRDGFYNKLINEMKGMLSS